MPFTRRAAVIRRPSLGLSLGRRFLPSKAMDIQSFTRRREFITLLAGAVVAWPLSARAQQPDGKPRIGFLGPERRLKQLRQGLYDLAYVEGQNIVIEHRPSDRADRLSGFAAELVGLKVDMIVASGSLAVRAAQQATRSIPIVMTGSSDPVGAGFVASLARPGGNITGR
jgi:putative tryptophan/tyrosine transport system substrate-binding protein